MDHRDRRIELNRTRLLVNVARRDRTRPYCGRLDANRPGTRWQRRPHRRNLGRLPLVIPLLNILVLAKSYLTRASRLRAPS